MAIEGFLHTKGKKIVDGRGEEILLTGWGLGNWLLQEGYMWKAYGERFDRPSRIEKVVEELTGRDFAEYSGRNTGKITYAERISWLWRN